MHVDPGVPLLPEGSASWSGGEAEIAAYRARTHAVGAFAFDASADLETVSEHLSTFLHAFVPTEGLRIRAARASKREVLPARFTRTSFVRANQLARGGTLELARRDLDPVEGRCAEPIFWIASRAPSDAGDDLAPLRFGLSVARPRADGPERAVAHALHTFIEACVELEGCVSAIVAAQGPPVTLASPSLAYEALAGTEADGARTGWLRDHVRAPGWRVLVPRARARDLAKKLPAGVTRERVRGGLLVQLDAPTPHAVTDTGPLERWLSPLLG
jgi:hypothetical protein